MTEERLVERAREHLRRLCVDIAARPTGSPGNQAAAGYLADVFSGLGCDVSTPRFECLDWVDGDVRLEAAGTSFPAKAGPYAPGCDLVAPLAVASAFDTLEAGELAGCALLLRGDVAREQLMPKSFTYYNPERHRRIVGALEAARPAVVIAATGRDPGLAGGLAPFPLLEDGDVDIPSVYLTEAEGERLARFVGHDVRVTNDARRVASWGCNVVATHGASRARRVIVCAHVDAKLGTPGALDDAAGVVTLLLLAELLGREQPRVDGDVAVELLAINGEDHYANPGERAYFAQHEGRLGDVALAINLDGVGYREGRDAYSTYGCEGALAGVIDEVFGGEPGLVPGPPWFQGDHAVFAMQGVPALAVTSEHVADLMDTVIHTQADTVDLVEPRRLVRLARALRRLIGRLGAVA